MSIWAEVVDVRSIWAEVAEVTSIWAEMAEVTSKYPWISGITTPCEISGENNGEVGRLVSQRSDSKMAVLKLKDPIYT